MFDGQTGSAPCIVSVSGAPFVMAWRFSRGSYFDLAKSFRAPDKQVFARRWGVAVTSTWSGILLVDWCS